jgi:hypothetical protein
MLAGFEQNPPWSTASRRTRLCVTDSGDKPIVGQPVRPHAGQRPASPRRVYDKTDIYADALFFVFHS